MFKKLSLAQKVTIQAILVILAIVYIAPFTNVVSISLRGRGFGNYLALFNIGMPIKRMFVNSLIVCVLQVALIVFISTLSAFAFSKLSFKGKTIIYGILLLTLAIPMISIITPLFITIKKLHLNNTYFALVFPAATLWLPVAIIIQKSYYDALGNEYMEDALMAGCSWFRIYRSIYFPLGLPATINVVVFAFINAWNDYLNALLFSRSMDMYTFPLAVIAVRTTIVGNQPETTCATLVIMAIPSIIIFLLLQKYLGEGMTVGALKG
jgi:ABC-type glycerol-3-phosphate transport system permease component